MNHNGLPSGWTYSTIGELAQVSTGRTPSRIDPMNFGGNIPWVKTAEVADCVIHDTDEHLSEQGKDDSKSQIFPAGSILVALYGQGQTRGRTALLGVPAATNQACAVILPSTRADQQFLWWWLRASYVPLREMGRGGTQPNLNLDIVRTFGVPVPPLPEQRRIVAILDKANAIRRKREEGIRLTEELLRSTFLEMFGDPAKQSLREEQSLGEVVVIASGQVDPREQPYASMPHVGGDNIESQTGEIRGAATAEELGLISGKYEFTPQDVLYSKIRPALNKVACPDFHGICSADIYPIRPITGKIGREYLASLLRSEDFLSFATKHSSRTNIPKINRPALLSYNVKLPLFSDQQQFEAAAKRIREMKHHRITACQVAETCFDSLVQRAFRGEL